MAIKKHITAAMIAASSILAAGAVVAQDRPAQEDYILRVDNGKIMVSRGGEFTDARTGEALAAGNRVTVCEGASATIDYGNGCSVQYTTPGCYIVQRDCAKAAVVPWGSTRPALGSLAALGGLAAIAGVILANADDVPAPPISR